MAQRTEPTSPSGGEAASAPDSPARGQPTWLRQGATVAFYLTAVVFAAVLLYYYATGAGGPTKLAIGMVPAAYVVAAIDDLRQGRLYPSLPPLVSAALAVVLIALACAAGTYLFGEFDAIRTVRVGRWNDTDMLAGATLVVLLLEYSRRKYVPLFVLNLLLVAYVVYGDVVPGLFGHSGMSWGRVITSMSLETSTGIFEQLPQLALTLIGSFILVLAVLQGFGAIDSILKGAQRLTARSPSLLPQAAVIGSFGVAAVSGSGAANAATTGAVTIPALIRSGLPPVRAAAIETATSLGGQLMPPLMGIAAFIMADFMGVSYFDVVARGFAPAIIYFLGVSLAVYLLTARFNAAGAVPDVEPMRFPDWVNLLSYAAAIGGLIWLMGVQRAPAMHSARRVFFALLVVLTVMLALRALRSRELRSPRRLVAPYAGFVETFARMTSELTLLLAILGLVTASFTITGVPTAVGQVLVDVASVHLVLVVLMAFAFGYVVGMGLPPAPTYIIVAVVIAPFMITAGLDPWQVHFYAFLIAVFGELSPPTSVTAAVTSMIAESPFTRTMTRAIQMCLPLLLLMVALFSWPEFIREPGTAQLLPAAMVLVATLGIITALHALFSNQPLRNRLVQVAIGAASVALLAHPILSVAVPLSVAVVVAIIVALRLTRARAVAELATARGQAAGGSGG